MKRHINSVRGYVWKCKCTPTSSCNTGYLTRVHARLFHNNNTFKRFRCTAVRSGRAQKVSDSECMAQSNSTYKNITEEFNQLIMFLQKFLSCITVKRILFESYVIIFAVIHRLFRPIVPYQRLEVPTEKKV